MVMPPEKDNISELDKMPYIIYVEMKSSMRKTD